MYRLQTHSESMYSFHTTRSYEYKYIFTCLDSLETVTVVILAQSLSAGHCQVRSIRVARINVTIRFFCWVLRTIITVRLLRFETVQYVPRKGVPNNRRSRYVMSWFSTKVA
jgi:hypothetical protein